MNEMTMQINSVTENALDLIRGGTDVNNAIIKSASKLNKEATQRVIENVNVERWLSFLKVADDKTKEYEIADPKKIILSEANEEMGNESLQKKASIGNDFYMPHNVSNTAQPLRSPVVTKSKETMVKEAQRKKEMTKHYEQTLLDAKETITKHASENINSLLFKLAQDDQNTEDYFDDLYSSIGNSSIPLIKSCANTLGVNHTLASKSIVKRSSLLSLGTKIIEDLHALKEIEKQSNFGVAMADNALKTIMKAQGNSKENYMKAEHLNDGERIALALKHKQIFEDLSSNDDILSERDPKNLAKMYKSMINIAPNIAADPEIVKAHLREASGYSVFGPYEAKTIAELQKTVEGKEPKKD